jgi:hypothetical protein
MANNSSTDQTSAAQTPGRDNHFRTMKLIKSRFDSLAPADQAYILGKLADPSASISDESFRSMKLIATKFTELSKNAKQFVLAELNEKIPQENQ